LRVTGMLAVGVRGRKECIGWNRGGIGDRLFRMRRGPEERSLDKDWARRRMATIINECVEETKVV
jgi:hypothetical protein